MSNAKMTFEDSIEYDLMTSDFGEKLMEKYQFFNKIHESVFSQIFILTAHDTNESFTLKAIRRNNDYAWDLDVISKIKNVKIANVIDVQTTDKYIYILKEYIHGVTLEEYVLRNGRLPEKTVVEMGVEICEILSYFHSFKPSPIVYRDLKPANLIVTDAGEIKLIDTDSVRQYKNDAKKDTIFFGTDGFASPEQFGFSQTDNRTDIYTLGTTLYFLLTGMKPETDRFKLKNIQSLRSDVSAALSRIIAKCTEFHPDARYQQVSLLKNDLLDLLKRGHLSKFIRFMKRFMKIKTIVTLFSLLLLVLIAIKSPNLNRYLNPGMHLPDAVGLTSEEINASAIPVESKTETRSQASTASVDQSIPLPEQSQTMQSDVSLNEEQVALVGFTSPTKATSTVEPINEPLQSQLPIVPSQSQVQDSFYEKTTILEAFWSGELPKKLPAAFTDFYRNESNVPYDPNRFIISIQEWKTGIAHQQMTDRINNIGGNILLKAPGHEDVACQITTDCITANDGTAQIYYVSLMNATDLKTGVRYSIFDPQGHWTANSDVFVERIALNDNSIATSTPSPSAPPDENKGMYDKTTILEAFWSGEDSQKLPVSFVAFVRQNVSARRKSDVFFVSIQEWVTGMDHSQMGDRIKSVGGDFVLRAAGYPDLVMYMDGGSMTANDGSAQVYFAYVENESDMVSNVKYQIVDRTGHWIVDEGVSVMRPEN